MFDLPRERSVPTASDPLRHARIPFFTALVDKAMTLAFRLTGKVRYDDFRMERVHGVPLVVMPSVLNPKLTRTGAFFASLIDAQLVNRNMDVLDMGTGSGVCALFAAKYAGRVVAVDINAAAVRCAGINARLNHLEHKIEVRHGDLFGPVAADRFDLVMFNPPFLRGVPRDDRDRAWRSSDVAERFAANLRKHLKPGGSALVLLSSFGDGQLFLGEFRKHGFAIAVLAEHSFVNERLAVFRLTPTDIQDAT